MKKDITKDGKYPRRGNNLNVESLNNTKCYQFIMDYAQNPQNGLDIQLRGNYMNIYYQGGNLLKLHIPTNRSRKTSPIQSDSFDKWYFYQQQKKLYIKKI